MMTLLFPIAPGTDAGPAKTVTWRHIWPVLVLAYALRLVFAHWAAVPLHPDETYQYYEQAYRLTHGYGVVPWEYVFGIRSWFIPLGLVGLLNVAAMLGLDQPHEYAFFIKAVLCLLSLVLPLGMYRLTQILWNEQAAIFSLLLGCFWHHFLYVAHKPMPSILAMYGLVWLVVWMLQPPTRARLFAFGALLGVVFALRYQLVPVLGLFWLIALYRVRGVAALPLWAGSLLSLVLAGVLDKIFWGGFLSSFIDNFRLNFSYDIASTFGVHETLYYAKRLITETSGLFVLGLLGVALVWHRIWPVVIAMALGVLAFHIPAHKELRFVLWILPFALIGAAVVTARFSTLHHVLHRSAPVVLGLWGAVASFGFSVQYLGAVPWQSTLRDGAAVMQALSQAQNVTAVDFRTPSMGWSSTPGYYSIGKPVPLYMWGAHSDVPEAERLARLEHVSHIVAEPGMSVPDGYVHVSQHGAFALWQSATPRPEVGLEGFKARTSYPAPIPKDFRTVGLSTPLMVQGW